jgi:hypothetical protein
MNAADSFGAAQSAALNFDTEDQAPSAELNQILWGAVKGPDKPFPTQVAPTGGDA